MLRSTFVSRVLRPSSSSSRVSRSVLLFINSSTSMSAANFHSSTARYAVPGPLVSVDWLKSNYGSVKVVDGSFFMPNENINPNQNFQEAHLPNAKFFDVDEWTDKTGKNAQLPHMMPSKATFDTCLKTLGISPNDSVVVYDAKGLFSAPRVRLTFQFHGVKDVAVLEGGIKAWKAAGGDVETGPVKSSSSPSSSSSIPAPAPASILNFSRDFIHDMEQVRKNSEVVPEKQAFQVVDARSKGRFDGTDPEPRPGLSSGHVQGAANVPFTALLDTDPISGATVLKPKPELRKVFKAAGVDVDGSHPIVASCGSGVTACVVLLGLEVLGRKKNVGLYDGSWTEWALEPANKIVKNTK